MRITYLHQYFNTPDMPGSTRSYEMARRLVMMGHEVNMITSWRDKDGRNEWFETDEAGIKIHWLPIHYSNHLSFNERIRAFFKFALLSANRAASLNSDVIFATSTPLTIALPAVYAAKKQKVPMVFEVRDLWPEMPIAIGALRNPALIALARILESFTYRHSSAVVALSPGMKEGVIRSGISSSRIAVIPNSCDNKLFLHDPKSALEFRSGRPWLSDKPLFLYAGAFGRLNDLTYAIKLAKELLLINSDIRILLVGDGSELNSLIEYSRRIGVFEKNLFFEPPIPKADTPTLFSAATISSILFMDLPEMRLNSSNKFFDSLAASKPLFLNYGGWMEKLVQDCACGITGWGRPLPEIARELNLKLHDSAWIKSSGSSSRKLAESFFDRDSLAIQLEKVLEAAVKGTPNDAESIAPGLYMNM